MKIISSKDPVPDNFIDKFSRYIKTLESMGFDYYIFMKNSDPIVIFFLGEEPINLIEPIGSPVGEMKIINYKEAQEKIEEIASKIIDMKTKNNLRYIFISAIPEQEKKLVNSLKSYGFKMKEQWYRMERPLDQLETYKGTLTFKKIERQQVKEFLEIADNCTVGSFEGEEEMENLMDVPHQFLTLWYNMQELYYAMKEKEIIGILDLAPDSRSNFNNIGVCPDYRSKGYGKQILLSGLTRLKDLGIEKAELKVHVKNERAIGLYKSFGFKIIEETIDMIHWDKIS
jgi:ribosomal protein S18 acetylase RimI-like enzyme